MRFHISLLLLDITCLCVSFLAACAIYRTEWDQLLLVIGTVIPTYVTVAIFVNAYSVTISNNIRSGIVRSLHALLIASTATLVAAFILKLTTQFSRVIFVSGFLLAAILLTISRNIILRGFRAAASEKLFNIGIITGRPEIYDSSTFRTVLDVADFNLDSDSPAMYNRLAIALQDVDQVFLECAPQHRSIWSHALQGANVSVEIIAPELVEIAPMGLGRFGNAPTIVVARGPLGLLERAMKRGFDLCIATSAILFLSPVLLLVSLAIRLETPGPVLFVQDRIGRSNRIFKIHKFRSMRVERSDNEGDRSTGRDDDRITRVGRVIRAFSIDELPQLFNVMRGDMSIVGPRPHALGSRAEGKLFWEINPRYWHRHAAKPGITGLAQVRGFRGSTVLQRDLNNRLDADLEYLGNWSLWLDLKIILMTFGVIVHRNAY